MKKIEFLIHRQMKVISVWVNEIYSQNDYKFDIFNSKTFSNSLDISHILSAKLDYNFIKSLFW
jgi:hypothetical protein